MKQEISYTYLKTLNPCENRMQHYLKRYDSFKGSWSEFLDLPEVSYDDKIWVAKRFLSINQLVHWAILCAQSVQPIFEEKYPEKKSLQNLFDYLKNIPDFKSISPEQREKIWTLRREVQVDAAAATYAATYAAAAAATYAAAAAVDAATYAAAAATYAATYAAAAAADAKEKQRALNIEFLKVVENL